jgi:hypothetical protein
VNWWPFLLVGALYAVPSPVTISVFPHVSMVPATVRLTVLAPRHVDNRRICWSVDGSEFKKSCLDLPGFDSRRVWTVYWPIRSPGAYEAVAVLTRNELGKDKIYTSRQSFQVIGSELP